MNNNIYSYVHISVSVFIWCSEKIKETTDALLTIRPVPDFWVGLGHLVCTADGPVRLTAAPSPNRGQFLAQVLERSERTARATEEEAGNSEIARAARTSGMEVDGEGGGGGGADGGDGKLESLLEAIKSSEVRTSPVISTRFVHFAVLFDSSVAPECSPFPRV